MPFKWGTYSRFGHFMLPMHYDCSPLWKYIHGVLAPVKWLWWRIVELMFKTQFGLKGDLLPKSPIELDVFGGGQILNCECNATRTCTHTRPRRRQQEASCCTFPMNARD